MIEKAVPTKDSRHNQMAIDHLALAQGRPVAMGFPPEVCVEGPRARCGDQPITAGNSCGEVEIFGEGISVKGSFKLMGNKNIPAIRTAG